MLEVMREIAKMQMGHGLDYDSKILEKARKQAQQRFNRAQHKRAETSRELERMEAKMLMQAVERLLESEVKPDQILKDLNFKEKKREIISEIEALGKESQKLTRADIVEALDEFETRGLIDFRTTTIRLTSRGASFLGRGFLKRILNNLSKRGYGPHIIDEAGYGTLISSTYHPYEYGDSYDRISIEKSILATLSRGGALSDFDVSDIRVNDARHHSGIHFGILVDQSGSMNRNGKIESAVEPALALSELIRIKFPEDRLRIFAFSEDVQEVAPWELPNIAVPMRNTDMRAALRTFRLSVVHETGNKQAHLITDSAPNYEDGNLIGFERALDGVLKEVRRYRMEDIVLNIVMLDEDPEARDPPSIGRMH
jgi:uncharacterized protein with von Willebrand factor type A (vWA) domain